MALPEEIEYWEKISLQAVNEKGIMDNVFKRPHQIRKLLEFNWYQEQVLEIGAGNGIIAGALQLAIGRHWSYIGTELAPNFRKWANKMFHLNVIEADVRELPGDGYTRIIAFDSLEHVRPEHREEGYKKISEVAAPGCYLFIHLSKEKSFHDSNFDHPFGLEDFVMLEKAGFTMKEYSSYLCPFPEGEYEYAFCIMRRNG